MEAPEKLYLEDDEKLFDLFPVLCLASTEKHGNDIEYVRKDVFINKACEYFSKHQCEYIDFEDFKKYMEE